MKTRKRRKNERKRKEERREGEKKGGRVPSGQSYSHRHDHTANLRTDV